MCEKCYRKTGKKTSASQYQIFEHNGMKIYDQQRMVQVQSLEALKALKGSSSKLVQVGSKLVQSWSKNGSSSNPWSLEALKALKALKRKKRRTCRHGVRRIWKLYSKGRPASKFTWCEPSGDHLAYRWRENLQRTSPQITGRAKAVTMLRLEKCVFRHTLGARIFYTSPLRKCQKTQRKTFW